jgi:hypothetical protein
MDTERVAAADAQQRLRAETDDAERAHAAAVAELRASFAEELAAERSQAARRETEIRESEEKKCVLFFYHNL